MQIGGKQSTNDINNNKSGSITDKLQKTSISITNLFPSYLNKVGIGSTLAFNCVIIIIRVL